MKSDFRYLPLFFLCWAFLFSPFAMLIAFQDQQKGSKAEIASSSTGAARHTHCIGMVATIYGFRCGSGINSCACGLSPHPSDEEAIPTDLSWQNDQSEADGYR